MMHVKKAIVFVLVISIVLSVSSSMPDTLASGSLDGGSENGPVLTYLGVALADGMEIPEAAVLIARYTIEAAPNTEYVLPLPEQLTAIQLIGLAVTAEDRNGNRVVIGEAAVEGKNSIRVSISDLPADAGAETDATENGGGSAQQASFDTYSRPRQSPIVKAVTGSKRNAALRLKANPEQGLGQKSNSLGSDKTQSVLATLEIPCAFDLAHITSGGTVGSVTLESGGRLITLQVVAPIAPVAPVALVMTALPINAFSLNRLEDVVTIGGSALKRGNELIDSGAVVSCSDSLMLGYTFSISDAQIIAIQAAIANGSATYEIPIPSGLTWSQGIGSKELKVDNADTFAEIWVDSDVAYIKFTGSFWDAPEKIEDGWLDLRCALDAVAINGAPDYDLWLYGNNNSITINILENQPIEHKLVKTGSFANNRFRWTASYIPGGTDVDYPLALLDTFDNQVHIYVPDSLKLTIGGEPYTGDTGVFVETTGTTTTIGYEITEPNKNKAVTLVYETRLADDQLKDAASGNATTAENTLFLKDAQGRDAAVPAVARVAVAAEGKKWMSKTGVQDNRHITWTVHVNTLDRDLTDLVMYDAIPEWLEPPTNVVVTKKGGGAISDFQWSTAAGDQQDGSAFCVKFTNPPYAPEGYTVTYTTAIRDAYFDDPAKTRNGDNKAWLTYDWRDYAPDGGPGPGVWNRQRTAPELDVSFSAQTNVIEKTALSYDRATHTIKWRVDLNPYGVYIASGVITDDLLSKGQSYVPGSFTGGTGVAFANADNGVLTVTVDELRTGSSWFTFESTVNSAADYAGNNSGKAYDNEAVWNGTINGVNVTDKSAASMTVASQMLTKQSLGYDYNAGTVTWQVVVNQNKMPMTTPRIVDTLSVGQRYVAGSASVYGGSLSDAVFDDVTGILTITLASTSETVSVTYKTKVDTDAIAAFKNSAAVTVTNHAVLSHAGHDGLASATASQTISNKFLNKIGSFNDGIISYDTGMNLHAITIPGNTVLTDTLPPGLRLDVTSVTLWNAEVSADGVFSKTTEKYRYNTKIGGSLVFDYSQLLSANKFSFTLPADAGRYVLSYDCFVMSGTSFSNSVSLSGGGVTGAPAADTCAVGIDAGGGGTSSRAARIIVEKVDSRRTGVKLGGVRFALYQRFAGGVLDDMLVAEATTGADGRAEFYPLSLNTTYVLKEVSAKAGYDKDTITASVPLPTGVAVVKTAGKDDELIITAAAKGDYNLTVTNVPADTELGGGSGGIQFRKRSDQAEKNVFIPVGAGAAEFTIIDQTPGSSFTMTKATDLDGLVRFTDLPFGQYLVRETKTPIYHTKAADFTVTVNADGITSDGYGLDAGTVKTVDNTYFRPSLTIQKKSVGGATASGIEFGLYEVVGNTETLLSKATTGSNGSQTFSALEPGITELLYGGKSYVVRELSQPVGYYTAGEYRLNTVNTAGLITANWSNFAHAASLTVTKTDSMRPGVKLTGARFALHETQADANSSTSQPLATATTDAAGAATFTGLSLIQDNTALSISAEPKLLATSYWLKEITPPDGYSCDTAPVEVVLDPVGKSSPRTFVYTASVSNTPVTADFTFTKYSEKDGVHALLSGAGFTITDQTTGSAYSQTAASGADGVATFLNVPFGTYDVEETSVPTNHSKYRNFRVTIDSSGAVTEFDGKTTSLTGLAVVNVVTPTEVELEKVSTAGAAMRAVPFALYRDMGTAGWVLVESKTTDAAGKVVFSTDLYVGDRYKIVETAPVGYYQPQEYEFTAAEKPAHRYRWINDPIDGKITVTKTDAVSGSPLAGVRYGLYAADAPGVLMKDVVTDASGVAVFDELPLAYAYSMSANGHYTAAFTNREYLVRELNALDGYHADPVAHTATLAQNAKNVNIVLTNEPIRATISFGKVNDWDIPLKDAVFTITGEPAANGFVYSDTATSGPDGQVRFADVPFGRYTIAEITAPADHILNPQTYTVEIGKNGGFIQPMPAKAVNSFHSLSVTVSKTNADTGGPIAGVVYEIYDSGGIKRGTATTDTHGLAEWNGLLVNETYTVVEVAAAVGYYPSEPVVIAAAYADETIDWLGYPCEGEITLTVTDKNTGRPIGGVGYGIYDGSGNVLGTAVSDANGWLIFQGLPLDTTAMATYQSPPHIDSTVGTAYTLRELTNVFGYDPANGDVIVTVPNSNPVADELVKKTPIPSPVISRGGPRVIPHTLGGSDEPTNGGSTARGGTPGGGTPGGGTPGGGTTGGATAVPGRIPGENDERTTSGIPASGSPDGIGGAKVANEGAGKSRPYSGVLADTGSSAGNDNPVGNGNPADTGSAGSNQRPTGIPNSDGREAFAKPNPKTGDSGQAGLPLYISIAVALTAAGFLLADRRKRHGDKP